MYLPNISFGIITIMTSTKDRRQHHTIGIRSEFRSFRYNEQQ